MTLLEKADALRRRFPSENVPPPMFVRHYEDLARLIQAISGTRGVGGFEPDEVADADRARVLEELRLIAQN